MTFDVRAAFGGVEWKGDGEQPMLVAELALWSSMSDGEIADDEIEAIVTVIKQVPALDDFSADACGAMVEKMAADCPTTEKIADRIVTLAKDITDKGLQRVTYKLAMYCAANDGDFSEAEADFLLGLQKAWGIDDAEADKLVSEVFGAA